MKALIKGVWHSDIADTPELRRARLEEKRRWFRDQVSADGSTGFPAAPGRYHLVVSHACPWAHRTLLYRKLKGLEGVVSVSLVCPRWAGPDGWSFAEDDLGLRHLYQLYQAAKPDFTGKVTVPVLWDRERRTIVNNESGEIIRMLNSAFDAWGDAAVDFYPQALRPEIEAMNALVLDRVCLGVYKAGFASTQEAYEAAVTALFEALDQLEERLAGQRFLVGERITESDWHLFCTLVRFDAVYHGALKCNLRRLVDYPALSAHARRLYQLPGVAETVRLDDVKRHYYDALGELNPEIVPLGPLRDFRDLAA